MQYKKPRKRFVVEIFGVTKKPMHTWAASDKKALGNVLARCKFPNIGDAVTELLEDLKAGEKRFRCELAPVLPRRMTQLTLWGGEDA